ncbi:hypothetical protein GLOTRDRAFT_134558 [Gloeophyllum trabeum ATCC 11539]|uniref:Uncharacterized protein n=1 Tax=Gloeophyllum trabeum (strain ATCC 11539 / FP-39264 / Madison 617) TaxID=670483 RepID=S7PR20_GLOTA|nr:uncharacterized protein GLOTRDRAFT_134558 [Gloeophyllum trabeum ATCC 11539]EPQ49832.1 hypothetical protein GLOTRDRAFT_134558 [Gloeophyllum trabeum ATCC 11539]
MSELLPLTSPTSPLGIGNGHWVVAPSAAKQAWQRQKELYGPQDKGHPSDTKSESP